MLQRLLHAFKPAARPVSRPANGAPDTSVDVAHGLVLEGQTGAARGVLARRLVASPDDADALALQGWVLFDLGETDQARALLARVLQLAPGHVEALNTLGALDADDPDPNLSIRWFRAALKSEPGNLGAQYNLAQKLFFLGEYEEGFRLLRARHRLHFKRDNPLEPMPMWQGGNLEGKTVFVWCDWGGLGDHLQFARYVQLLRDRARPAHIRLGCQPECVRLFQQLAGADTVVAPGSVPVADFHVPLLDLPWRFETGRENIPAPIPYLTADTALMETWRERLFGSVSVRSALRAGLVWATGVWNQGAVYDRIRIAKSIPLDLLAPLAKCSVQWVSLQKGVGPGATPFPMLDTTASISDFADTAAIIANLDVVVSADTAVAHLAAAMGKPVILLLRYESGIFWSLAKDGSPWYPSMRILRQPSSGAWGAVVARTAAMLAGMRTGI